MKVSETLIKKDNQKPKEEKIEDLEMWNSNTAIPGVKYRTPEGAIVVKS